MTNLSKEDFIKILKNMLNDSALIYERKALNMAIRALKNEQTDGDLISRESVITMLQKIENAIEDGDGFQFNEWIEYAKDIPSAEKTAEWEVYIDCEGKTRQCTCKNCGYKTGKYTWKNPNYCPDCGCRMKKEIEENAESD